MRKRSVNGYPFTERFSSARFRVSASIKHAAVAITGTDDIPLGRQGIRERGYQNFHEVSLRILLLRRRKSDVFSR